jgi:hypothetical protein
MQDNVSTYRIHTGIGSDAPSVVNVPLKQTFDTFEILSLKLTQANSYNFYESSYGVVVGRVLANDAFGIPNAKVSIFLSVEDGESIATKGLYPFTSIRSNDNKGVRYNLLPDEQVNSCHQNVGTFPNKRLVLDNNDIIEVFDKYWKYTTVTNEAGDYMMFGIPTGDQQLHVDVDLSDIGVLSQRPRDMVYKGYNIDLFESPNKFKQSKNLDSLSQIYSQNKGLYVYPYWGDTSNTQDTIAITRCDIQLEYKFEPTCVFMGSILSDQGGNAIGKSCAANEGNGRMEKLKTGEGTIEMIRKTIDGKVEEYPIKGNKLIDGDGVWCYQIPMNLDYVRMDEYGNIVPTDNPDKGIPTRTRVRFRISMDDTPNDAEARKRCKYLVPNNPRLDEVDYPIYTRTKELDYEFGSATREESYKDLFWNKVYTVKSYIPRLQKNSKETNRKHTGIKAVNYYGDGTNPFPYNNVSIKLSFTYRLICVITKFIIYFVGMLNMIFSTISLPICAIVGVLKALTKIPFVGKLVKPLYKLFKAIVFKCIGLGTEFCDDGINRIKYFIGCFGCSWTKTEQDHNSEQIKLDPEEQEAASNPGITNVADSTLFNCVENQLAQDNNAVNFNFHNDWINGVLYAPLWYRKITAKKSFLFGLFRKKAKDEWCSANRQSKGLKVYHPCAVKRSPSASDSYENNEGLRITPNYIVEANDCGKKCHEAEVVQTLDKGIILPKENMYGQTVYYYQAAEYHPEMFNNKGGIVPLFATDIVLLGSLNDCDLNGIPQFYKYLTESTYNMPSTILFTDGNVTFEMDKDGNLSSSFETFTEATGCDWGNINKRDECGRPDGGLFYNIGCSTIETIAKSCLNLSRICEFGVYLDETKFIENIKSETEESEYEENLLIPDGFISYDELYNMDARSMFATMNSNYLRTKLNKTNGLYEYDFRFLYPENFDGSLRKAMEDRQKKCDKTYKNNYKLETFSRDYYKFRMGDNPKFFENGVKNGLPMYENSYYFYFGLNSGKTAIDKFNKQFFSNCENAVGELSMMVVETQPNSWCTNDDENKWDGYIRMDLSGILTPYSIIVENQSDTSIRFAVDNINDEKIYFSRTEQTTDDFNGYSWIREDNGGDAIYISNGIYNIEVTDGNGNVSSSEINMKSKYLSYNTYIVDFEQPNNTLMMDYGTLCRISSEGIQSLRDSNIVDKEIVTTDSDVRDKIGGMIGIYDIYFNNESVFSQNMELRLTIQPSAEQTISSDNWQYIVNIKNGVIQSQIAGGECSNTNSAKLLNYGDSESNLKYIIVGVPKGEVNYDITLMQLCDGKETGNSIKQTVRVNDPLPYKLFINSLDYEIIKRFSTGWTISGNTDNPRINIGGNINGWLDISNPNNGYYDWDANELYKIDYYIRLGMTQAEAEGKVNEMKTEFINTMKSAFYVNCQGTPKTITFEVQTSHKPYETNCIYREEEANEDGTLNQLISCDNTSTNDTYIEGIEIPTITTVDNPNFGNKDYIIGDGICFAMDNTANKRLGCSGTKKLKNPYFVACVNSKGKTLPMENVGVNGDDASGYTLNGSVSGYFGFHLIDKIFNMNMMSWAYFNDIPYYWPSNADKYGKSLTMNGLFTGIINNGSSTSNTILAKFDEQLLGSKELKIETYKTTNKNVPDEDAIPTKRVIIGENTDEYPEYKIKLPYIKGDIQSETTYASVANKLLEVAISDDSCRISEDVYGNMRIILSEQSINDCKDKKNTILRVSVSGGGDEVKTMYAIKVTMNGKVATDYIVNKLTDEIKSYDDYGVMKYEITKEDLENMSYKNLNTQKEKEDDEKVLEDSKGYGTTGIFTTADGIDMESLPIYIVAVTTNNCRCISPVYDFTKVEAQIILVKQTVNTPGTGTGSGSITTEATSEGGEEGEGSEEGEGGGTTTQTTDIDVDVSVTTPVVTYKFGIRIKNVDDLYYFKNYPYSADISCTAVSGNNITGTAINEDGNDNAAYFEINQSVYDTLVQMASSPFTKPMLLEKTTVIAKDYTGLRHRCVIIDDIDMQEIVIGGEQGGKGETTE